MKEWRVFSESLDMGWQWGIGIGRYAGHKPIAPTAAIRFNKDAPAVEVAKQLRLLADAIEKDMKD